MSLMVRAWGNALCVETASGTTAARQTSAAPTAARHTFRTSIGYSPAIVTHLGCCTWFLSKENRRPDVRPPIQPANPAGLEALGPAQTNGRFPRRDTRTRPAGAAGHKEAPITAFTAHKQYRPRVVAYVD